MRAVSLVFCLFVVGVPIGWLSWLAIPASTEGVSGAVREPMGLRVDGDSELLAELELAIADLQFAYRARMGDELAGGPMPEIVLIQDPSLLAQTPLGGFEISGSAERLLLSASNAEGVRNALYALCRDWLGVRWYWDSVLGFEVVESGPLDMPELPWAEAPAFVQRTFSPGIKDFGRRNRLSRPYDFNHNLARVFTKERYAESVDGFSLVGGRYWEPEGSHQLDVNPNFTSGRAVELGAAAALAHFAKHPESTSFSLSINDNVHFDESKWTQMALTPLSYYRGRPNYTDLVFRYMNLVARKVFDEGGAWETPSGQPRYLTALAYYWTEASPSFSVHSRVMPVLTSDRAQWHDPAYRADDRALIERWCASGAERVGTWDYYFGAPFLYPRQFNQWIDASIKHLHASGVDVFYTQLPAVWGLDGPKAWLTAELLWDPTQDAERLLDEYYGHFFGAAGGAMRRFYERAEGHRAVHEGRAAWIKLYKDEGGIRMFSGEVLAALRNDLNQAAEAVEQDARRRARVQVVLDAFQLTELYFELQCARERLALERWRAVDDGASLTDELQSEGANCEQEFSRALLSYTDYAEQLVEDPMHARFKRFTTLKLSDPRLLLEPIAWESRVSNERAERDGLQHAEVPWEALNFLGPALPQVSGWSYWIRAAEGFSVTGVADAPGHPDGVSVDRSDWVPGRGFRLENTDMCWLETRVGIQAGVEYAIDATIASRVSLDNRNQFMLDWRDADGRVLLNQYPLQLPRGDWSQARRFVVKQTAPEGAAYLDVRFSVSRQSPGDYFELSEFSVVPVEE